MAVDKTKLREELNKLPILEDEKNMWCELGFYIDAQATLLNSHGYKETRIVDAMANEGQLGKVMAGNIRGTIIAWWQNEKTKLKPPEKK